MLTTGDLFKIFVYVRSGTADPDKIRKGIIDGKYQFSFGLC